jgi:hypothetical protein
VTVCTVGELTELRLSDAPAWRACGLGICAANDGHDGTCAEASGWGEL